MKRTALFFGSFNPIHVGHLIIANTMVQHEEVDEVWLVVSPQNPLKERSSLLADHHRMAMVRRALDDNYKLKACDIEMHLPVPQLLSPCSRGWEQQQLKPTYPRAHAPNKRSHCTEKPEHLNKE